MTIQELAEALVEQAGLEKDKIQRAIKELEKEAFKILKDAKDPFNVEGIQKYLDRIFEICPDCNFVPLAYDYNEGTTVITDKDFDELEAISTNIKQYTIPYENDDMRYGDVKDLWECWQKSAKYCNIQKGEDAGQADYTENIYYGVWGYSKTNKKVEYLGDVNC
jgi:hypothetical protein